MSVYLRLAAPIQSWAGPKLTGNIVRTLDRPPRRALEGLIAGGFGWKRGEWEDWIHDITIKVRTDVPGWVFWDFQTNNPRHGERAEYAHVHEFLSKEVAFKKGRSVPKTMVAPKTGVYHYKPASKDGTVITRRSYLGGATFLVEIDAGERNHEVLQALTEPKFGNYLGRADIIPTFPYILGEHAPGALEVLPAAREGQGDAATLRLDTYTPAGTIVDHVTVPIMDEDPWEDLVFDIFDGTQPLPEPATFTEASTWASIVPLADFPANKDGHAPGSYEQHIQVMSLFPTVDKGKTSRPRQYMGVQFHQGNFGGKPVYLVRSLIEPTNPTANTVTKKDQVLDVEPGNKVHFRININAIRRSKNGATPIAEEDMESWLQNKFTGALENVKIANRKRHVLSSRKRETIQVDRVAGTATVTDRAELTRMIEDGVGRAKAYGCGMLLIQPATQQ